MVISKTAISHNHDVEQRCRRIEGANPPVRPPLALGIAASLHDVDPLERRPSQYLEEMRFALEELLESVDEAQGSHAAFMTGSNVSKAPVDWIAVAEGIASPKAIVNSQGARERISFERTQVCRTTKRTLTKAQRRAISQFDDIDAGEASVTSVLEQIPDNNLRIMARIEFYRDRSDLVLPPIEENFLNIDKATGSQVVDVARLRSLPSCNKSGNGGRPRALPSGNKSARQVFPRELVVCPQVPCTAREMYQEEVQTSQPQSDYFSTTFPALSHVSSTHTLSPSSSMESLHQRAARLYAQGQIRDRRIQIARDTAREQSTASRHELFDRLQQKSLRKTIAGRDKTLMTWMVLAMATDTMARVWKSFVTLNAAVKETARIEEDALVRRGIQDISDMRLSQGRLGSLTEECTRKLVPNSRRTLHRAISRRWHEDVEIRCRNHAYHHWCYALRVCRFIAILHRKIRLNNYAEIIKDLINSSWRGYRIRASMKCFMLKVRHLQIGMRSCVQLRSHIRNFVMLPMLWQIETTILGKLIGMPQSVLEQELEAHRMFWDLKQRIAEARTISESRNLWRSQSFERHLNANTTAQQESTSMPTPQPSLRKKMAAKKKMTYATEALQGVDNGSSKSQSRSSLSVSEGSGAALRRRKKSIFSTTSLGLSGASGKISHPMMEIIDKHRLSQEVRENLVRHILKENTDRWLIKFREYQEQCKVFVKVWQKWRLAIMALGATNREMWPPPPAIPMYPHELTKVDTKALRSKILIELKMTKAGQLL
jgi:hypothetical protein